jgi:hypothetical protein
MGDTFLPIEQVLHRTDHNNQQDKEKENGMEITT